MIGFKAKKYFIIDPQQVFAGEIVTHVIHPDDIVLKEIDHGISIVLKQGLQIIRYLKNLTEEHDYELVFNSQLAEEEQMNLLSCLNTACKLKSHEEFPKVTAMTVKDNIAYKNVDIKNPMIITNKDHGIWIAGYSLDSYGDDAAAELLDALSKLLEIKEFERQNSLVMVNNPAIAKITEKKGWRTLGRSFLPLKDILKDVLESLEAEGNQEKGKVALDSNVPGAYSQNFNSIGEGLPNLAAKEEENIKDVVNEKENSLPS